MSGSTKSIAENEAAASQPPRERLVGVDWIRLWAFLAILSYHGSWFFWPTAGGPPNPFPTTYWHYSSEFAFYSSYSGFTIVFVTAFILGLKRRVFSGKRWLPFFLLAGWVHFSAIVSGSEGRGFFITWDIYPFLLLTFVFADELLARLRERGRAIVALASAVALLVPFWRAQEALPLSFAWKMVLVGVCPEDFGDWPLFPWSALVFGGLALGQVYRDRPREFSLSVRDWEWPVLALALAAFFYVMPHYYATPLGDGWACYIFRRPVPVFWGYFVGILAMLRLCVAPEVQRLLSGNPITRSVCSLGLSRRFFVAYLAHYVFLWIAASLILPQAQDTLWLYDAGHLGALFAVELTARLTAWLTPRRSLSVRSVT